MKRWKSIKPSEHEEQVAVLHWVESQRILLPEASLLFAIPNGGSRSRTSKIGKDGSRRTFSPEGRRLQAEGVRAGIPDLFLPIARRDWHGLFLEMKTAGGQVTIAQSLWHEMLKAQGYAVQVCYGADTAIAAIYGYLMDPTWEIPALAGGGQ